MLQTSDVGLGMHMLEVEITTRCNLNCAHCYNRGEKKKDMPLLEVVRFLRFSEKNGVSSFVISGGEACMHPDFSSLVSILKREKKGVRVVLQSNGFIANKASDLLQTFDLIHLSFEPDGSTVREESGQKTLALAERLKEIGIHVYLFATIHKENMDRIDWMIQAANSIGVEISFNLCITTPPDRDLTLSVEETKVVTEKLHNLFLKGRIPRFTSPLTAILKGKSSKKYIGNRAGCTAGIAACVISPNGDVFPCPFLRVSAGNIHQKDLTDIWFNSPVFVALRDRRRFDEPCKSCKYLSYCGGCRMKKCWVLLKKKVLLLSFITR